MSRIGKLPIKLADKVKVTQAGQMMNIEGPKGKLSVRIPSPKIKLEVKDGELLVTRPDDSRESRALHGLTRAIMANAAKGVATGWEKKIDIRGVGFRAEVKGRTVNLTLGFSHP